jgi:hypothetical protein
MCLFFIEKYIFWGGDGKSNLIIKMGDDIFMGKEEFSDETRNGD